MKNFIKDTEVVKPLLEKHCEFGQVQLYHFANCNVSESSRALYVSLVASACYGKEYASNPEKLYQSLIRSGHFSPLEFIRGNPPELGNDLRNNPQLPYEETPNYYVYKIQIPLFVKNHLIRHRNFSFMEISRRFTTVSQEDFFIISPLTEEMVQESIVRYNKALQGYKPEIARLVLPAYALKTTLWIAGSIDNYKDLIIKRLCDNSQKETKEVVKVMGNLLRIVLR